MDTHESDAAIIAASRHTPDRFAALFERHYARIFRFVSRRIGAQAADDVASETFLVAFRRRGDYDTRRTDAAPWLYGIATRQCRAYARTERRILMASAARESDPDDAFGPADRALTPSGRLRLCRALADLRQAERDTLALHALADLTYDEIAVALGVRPGTVASRVSRARAKLAAALGSDDPTPPFPVRSVNEEAFDA